MLPIFAHATAAPAGIPPGRTCRVGASIVPGACHVGARGLGMLGADIIAAAAVGEHGPGLMANDALQLDREYRLVISSSTFATGTLVVYEDGAVEFTGPGSATQTLYESSLQVGAPVPLAASFAPVQATFSAALDTITGVLAVGLPPQATLQAALESLQASITVGAPAQATLSAQLETIEAAIAVGAPAQASFAAQLGSLQANITVGVFTFGNPRGRVVLRPALRTIGAQEIY